MQGCSPRSDIHVQARRAAQRRSGAGCADGCRRSGASRICRELCRADDHRHRRRQLAYRRPCSRCRADRPTWRSHPTGASCSSRAATRPRSLAVKLAGQHVEGHHRRGRHSRSRDAAAGNEPARRLRQRARERQHRSPTRSPRLRTRRATSSTSSKPPTRSTILAIDNSGAALLWINPATLATVKSLAVGTRPGEVALSPDDTRAYVLDTS